MQLKNIVNDNEQCFRSCVGKAHLIFSRLIDLLKKQKYVKLKNIIAIFAFLIRTVLLVNIRITTNQNIITTIVDITE